jgi:hypothetical protein
MSAAPPVVRLAAHPGLDLIAPCGNPVIGVTAFRFLEPSATNSGVAQVTCTTTAGRVTVVMAIWLRQREPLSPGPPESTCYRHPFEFLGSRTGPPQDLDGSDHRR